MKYFKLLNRVISKMSTIRLHLSVPLLIGLMTCVSLSAQTASYTIDVSTGSYTLPLSTLGHNNNTPYTITGTTTTNTITITTGYQGTITLDNLTITSSKARGTALYGSSGFSCITVEGDASKSNKEPVTQVNIILVGQNTLTYTVGNFGCPLQVNQGAQIHINSIDPTDNLSGSLTATNQGSSAAAIGSPYYLSSSTPTNSVGMGNADFSCASHNKTAGGNIIIGSGTVTAKADAHAAALGGGQYTFYDGIILIYGGIVTATSGYHGAAVGSGCPTGAGVIACAPPNSTIVAIPPASISAKADGGSLAGASNITYLNDPNKPVITVYTEDYLAKATIYIDMAGSESNQSTSSLFDQLLGVGVGPDLKKVKLGMTGSDGKFTFNGEFKDAVTIFTDAAQAATGRPYVPKEFKSADGSTVVLELFQADISLLDVASTPLEVDYTSAQAFDNAHRINIVYNDEKPMSGLTFNYSSSDFENAIYYKGTDTTTPIAAPTTLSKGDLYTIVLPIKQGKDIGIYNNVLTINGVWNGEPLPGLIRKVAIQKVAINDTGTNQYIKLTALKKTFEDSFFPNITSTEDLSLTISHTGTGIVYDTTDVVAKYLITQKPNYGDAVKETPLTEWPNLIIPHDMDPTIGTTTVSFLGFPEGVYYIHWYVVSGVVFAHSEDFQVPLANCGGFGPYTLAIPLDAGTISGNPYVCQGSVPQTIKGDTPIGGSRTYTYQWQISQDETTWTSITGATDINYTPAKLVQSPSYYRRITTDGFNASQISNVFKISNAPDVVLYWKGTKDRNWNDAANWQGTVDGTTINMIPVACNDVVIPSGLTNYPLLSPEVTPTSIYGSPICSNITFEYGSELAYQHKLIYNRAIIKYNWRYYSDFTDISYGSQPTKSLANGYMQRDKWYALSAPLKSMASGDFGFNGYPITWQAGFALVNPETGIGSSTAIEVGNFVNTYSKNDMPLSETNNAIAVKVPSYADKIGYKDHKNLEKLNGIVQIPYLDSTREDLDEHGHTYDSYSFESKFYYFNAKTLQQIYSPVGTMKRADESYRFVYENQSNIADKITVSGVQVPGYKQRVQKTGTDARVMVGNPFMSKINSKLFFTVNSNVLDEAQGYSIYDSQTSTWTQLPFADTNFIPAYQSFIVYIKGSAVDLLYPLEGDFALTRSLDQRSVAQTPKLGLYMQTVNNEGVASNASVLELINEDESIQNVRKMIHPDGYATPETFFIGSDVADYNLIQKSVNTTKEIGIAVKSSDTNNSISFVFDNVDAFAKANNASPILVDTYKNVKLNLLLNDTYYFTQRSVESSDSFIDSDRFKLQLLSVSDESLLSEGLDISIVYTESDQLEIRTTGKEIIRVEIYDLKGHICYKKENISSDSYSKQVPLNSGVYLVKVTTKDGSVKSEKIIAQ